MRSVFRSPSSVCVCSGTRIEDRPATARTVTLFALSGFSHTRTTVRSLPSRSTRSHGSPRARQIVRRPGIPNELPPGSRFLSR